MIILVGGGFSSRSVYSVRLLRKSIREMMQGLHARSKACVNDFFGNTCNFV
jgi:hypothetical protein